MDINQAQKLLQQLKENYLAELPQRCDDMEALVLALARDPREVFEELYRMVHSTKGSAGTHGLTIISSICHSFEDQLNRLSLDAGGVSSHGVDLLLGFIDLIRQVVELASSGASNFGEVEVKLDELRSRHLRHLRPCLLIDSSSYTTMMCENALKLLPVQITVVDDGLKGLERLLHDRYDFIIAARQTKTLNAFGIIGALRESESLSKHAQVIMLTSGKDKLLRRTNDPDFVVKRDPQMGENLFKLLQQLLEKLPPKP